MIFPKHPSTLMELWVLIIEARSKITKDMWGRVINRNRFGVEVVEGVEQLYWRRDGDHIEHVINRNHVYSKQHILLFCIAIEINILWQNQMLDLFVHKSINYYIFIRTKMILYIILIFKYVSLYLYWPYLFHEDNYSQYTFYNLKKMIIKVIKRHN